MSGLSILMFWHVMFFCCLYDPQVAHHACYCLRWSRLIDCGGVSQGVSMLAVALLLSLMSQGPEDKWWPNAHHSSVRVQCGISGCAVQYPVFHLICPFVSFRAGDGREIAACSCIDQSLIAWGSKDWPVPTWINMHSDQLIYGKHSSILSAVDCSSAQ